MASWAERASVARPVRLPASEDRLTLASRIVLPASLCVGVVALLLFAQTSTYGLDFHGIWRAGAQVLAGHSPYVAANAHALLRDSNAFITPPPLAVLAMPFSVLPFPLAVGLWNVMSVVAFLLALRVLGVRDRRVQLVALASLPFVNSLAMGQPDGVFALLAALAWRHRDSDRGAIAAGALIAAKLLAWPLVLWLLVTGRARRAAVAAGSAVTILLASWAPIGFAGLARYPSLLRADAVAFTTRSHSIAAAAMHAGLSRSMALAVMLLLALAFTALVVRVSRRSDVGLFTAGLTLGLMTSPVLWSHYLVLLMVPMAITRPKLGWLWLLAATAFWLSPTEPAVGWQIAYVLAVTAGIVIALSRRRPVPPGRRPPHRVRPQPAPAS